ncbi:sigma factor [Streptomyces platensis]|uniref:sigma factor n=1 Tax=Streptomyces platensis TaxID=58346 RepID=UPI002E276FFB|nr:sigma factor [Streptomyces platensis]
MTETLTLALIADAQTNGLEGTSAVLDAMTGRMEKLADAAARRMSQNGHRFEDFREDFRQDAALAMFEALPRFDGSTVDAFFAFMWSTIENVLKDKVREARNQGADEDALKVFASMLEKADGDVYLAEKFAQTVPPKGRRLSADRAQAARMSWQGALSLDYPASAADGPWDGPQVAPLVEQTATTFGVPEDLITPEDITSEERRQKHAIVNAILDAMSANQADALRYSYGIGGVETFGTGDAGDLPGLAAKLGLDIIPARDARVKGHKSFAKRYIKAVAKSEAEAKELTEAAAINLGRGGRK